MALGSQFVGSIWSWFRFTAASVDRIHFAHVPSSTLMLHHCIVSPLMQESLSFDSDMALYLHFCSSYDDLQDLLTIFDLPHSLLHHLCFPHINRPSCNHYFLLFSFVLLIDFAVFHLHFEFLSEDFELC